MIRTATLDDVDNIESMVEKLYAESGHPLPYKAEDTKNTIKAIVEQGTVYVSEYGVFGVLCFSSLFNQDIRCAQEVAWWVDPEFRGYGHAVMLVRFAEEDLKKNGVDVIFLSHYANNNSESTVKKMGYKEAEKSYVRYL